MIHHLIKWSHLNSSINQCTAPSASIGYESWITRYDPSHVGSNQWIDGGRRVGTTLKHRVEGRYRLYQAPCHTTDITPSPYQKEIANTRAPLSTRRYRTDIIRVANIIRIASLRSNHRHDHHQTNHHQTIHDPSHVCNKHTRPTSPTREREGGRWEGERATKQLNRLVRQNPKRCFATRTPHRGLTSAFGQLYSPTSELEARERDKGTKERDNIHSRTDGDR